MPATTVLEIGLAALLDVVVLLLLAKGPLRRFPFAFVFCSVQLVINAAETVISFSIGSRTKFYTQFYWAADMVAHLCILLVIVALIYRVMAGNPMQKWAPAAGVLAGVAVGVVSLVFYHAPLLSKWMTPVTRNLSFTEEILNFVLWGLLLEKRDYDRQLLMVSAGIGIQVTGEVIGHTLRIYATSSIVWLPNFLVFVCEILCLLIWIAAFLPSKSAEPVKV